jgi:DNA-binding transcriptional regulator PaaX
LLQRLKEQRLLEQQGCGQSARFTITADGIKRAAIADPAQQWNRPWDGKWRVFGYDLPLPRRRDRQVLWRALRTRKLGLLQQSLWIWPHDVTAVLMEIVEAQGIPECFCGFESGRLFLCRDDELVTSAWEWKEITRRHQTYLKHTVATVDSVNATTNLTALARIARIEGEAYQYAFWLDPLLPCVLWPKDYRGAIVEQRHQAFRAAVRRRLTDLIT